MKSGRHKIRTVLRREMKKIIECPRPKKLKDSTFFFCWGQAKFDTLMDIDRELKLGAFMKERKEGG